MKRQTIALLLAALALGISKPASAQKWADAPQYHIGVRAGLIGSIPLQSDWDGHDGTRSLWSPSIGVSVDTRICKLPFYIESGLYWMDRGYRYGRRGNTTTEHNYSLLLPALLSYHAYTSTQVSLQPFMGPYLAYGLNYREPDYGWRMGVGVNVRDFYANVGFDLGLRDNFDHGDGNVSSVFVTFGWNIVGKR